MKKYQKAFTLAEAMIAVVIIGIAATALILPFNVSATNQHHGAVMTLSSKLASDLMQRTLNSIRKDIADPNTSFLNIAAKYDGYQEQQGHILDAEGTEIADDTYDLFGRSIKCVYVNRLAENGNDSYKFMKVTVNVFFNSDKKISLKRLVTDR